MKSALFPSRQGKEHGDLLAIGRVKRSVEPKQIAFFVGHAHQNVDGHADSEEQMPGAHQWDRPESDEQAEHERVADEAVEAACHEGNRLVVAPAKVEIDLPQPEEIEVIDEEGRKQRESPAKGEENPQDGIQSSLAKVPDDGLNRLPLQKHQQ